METVYKILHIPSGEYVTHPSYEYRSKKGRAWKRYCDVLVAWKTVRARIKTKGKGTLIEDYRIQVFEMQLVETMAPKDVLDEIEQRDILYAKRKLKEQISTLEWRIREGMKQINTYSYDLPKMKEELEKLNKKFSSLYEKTN